jgi:Ca-activated chloride channel family protein
MIHFAQPLVLLLLPLLFALLYDNVRRGRARKVSVGWSDLGLLRQSAALRPAWEEHLPITLTALSLALLIVALARPQAGLAMHTVTSSGINIMLCVDTSGSMQAEDLQPSRVLAARNVSKDFVSGRPEDRIGLVVFAANPITMCPLTLDHTALHTMLDSVKAGMTKSDGTAIGNALATCVNRLKDVPGKSKAIVLLTDGRNNMGEIDPVTAARLAASFGIKIYTVGLGTHGPAPFPVNDPMFGPRTVMIEEDLDENQLSQIADVSGGKYFRATDTPSLQAIYKEIDRMEKSPVPRTQYLEYRELYGWLVLPALLMALAGGVLERTLLAEVP